MSKNPPGPSTCARRPPWLKVKIRESENFRQISKLLEGLSLNTVCEHARCPNIWECFGEHRTATFMILGEVCTRACRYCSVQKGKPPRPPDPQEPAHVAAAVEKLALRHAVITSVDRDDLEDFGASHFAKTVLAIRARVPTCRVELLTPDFKGDERALQTVLDTRPEVLGHNLETVARLYGRLRPLGSYPRALALLARVASYRREAKAPIITKSGLMLGLGEDRAEILAAMDDLRAHDCDVLTLGQYLNPTKKHEPVHKFYTPAEFDEFCEAGRARGFRQVVSGPLVRSSYHAHELFS